MGWYDGPTLIEHLETVALDERRRRRAVPDARPIGQPARPGLPRLRRDGRAGRGPAGRSGARPAGRARHARVERIVTFDGDLDEAVAGQSVTLELADQVDCARGDVIAAADAPLEVADQFEATIVWMDEHEMLPGRSYWLKLGTTDRRRAARVRPNMRSTSTRRSMSPRARWR